MYNAALYTHAEILRLRDVTELNNDGMHGQVRRRALTNRSDFINFSERDLINDDSSFCSLILSTIDLQYRVFFSF